MKLLSVGCGGQRDQSEHWWNLDCLRQFLKEGTPERINLDQESRYIECDLQHEEIPFAPGTFDGVLCQHVIEHFSAHDSVALIQQCHKVLKAGGVLVCSVPNAEYFLCRYNEDTREKAEELFGEPICPDEPEHKSFFDYALFHPQHQQILTPSSLRCLLLRGGFVPPYCIYDFQIRNEEEAATLITQQLNRRRFSSILYAYKQ